MKLLLAIISSDDTDAVCESLAEKRIPVANVSVKKSFLGLPGQATVIAACPDEEVNACLQAFKDAAGVHKTTSTNAYGTSGMLTTCEEGGGAVFVIDIEQFVRL